jgi:hypothetical protein
MTDYSTDVYLARMAIIEATALIAAPHTRLRPRIFPDGDKWCALYGEGLMMGVCGFGDTPEAACADFDKKWSSQLAAVAAIQKGWNDDRT